MAHVRIHYCKKCRWMLRAAWMAQELLVTFEEELRSVSLEPGEGGVFQIWANQTLVWDRQKEGGFPEIKLLKQRVRDFIAPDKDLGHSDVAGSHTPEKT